MADDVVWMLEPDAFADGDVGLADAVRALGGRVRAWSDDRGVPAQIPSVPGEVAVFHGSLGVADRIARQADPRLTAFCATDRFACSSWWPAASGLLVTTEHELTTVERLVAQGPPEAFGERVFVRPDSPLKPFSGRVLHREDISLRTLDHGFYYDAEDLPVVVTPAVEVGREWRLVVAEGAVVTGCGYLADGRTAGQTLAEDHLVWAFATEVVASIEAPEPVFVLDVCQTPGGLRLLELNPFSGADLYACDRAAIVEAVSRVVTGGAA